MSLTAAELIAGLGEPTATRTCSRCGREVGPYFEERQAQAQLAEHIRQQHAIRSDGDPLHERRDILRSDVGR